MIDWDEPCRHLFYVDGQWNGCGSYDWDSHKNSLFAVLDKVGEMCASAMKVSLADHEFNLQFHGSMIGPTGICLWLDREEFGSRFTTDLTSGEEEAMSLGVGWLNSLQPGGVTKQADDETIKWIDDWERLRDRHLTIRYFRQREAPQQNQSASIML